jgi:tRNA uridine 5-carboxymethylaminomethyl modification enzyme
MLNTSRGPAAWGHRAQISRTLYKKHMQQALAKVENLEVQPGSVADLIWVEGEDGWKVGGVKLGTSVFSVCQTLSTVAYGCVLPS